MVALKRTVPGNRLLAALSTANRREFVAHCREVKLEFAQVLCEAGEPIHYVYFPLDGFISLVTTLDDGARLEVGIVGNEGMLGTSLVLGVEISPQQAVVQGAGLALRMNAAFFRRHWKDSGELRLILNRYIHVLMGQLAQTAACVRHHLVEPRLARWLLLTRDRAHSDQFRLTHEFMAYMLGVRRVGITKAACALQARGLIGYKRGEVVVLDGAGLEAASCRCYRDGNAIYEQTLARGLAMSTRS